ncbi:hypothetical protein [Streptomyces sp. NPDC088789]|uniref:hypothetical protein n=1 Tax=Streptomyces sp. NPDC088789 TaxID=3365899 RepID=UPI0038169B95
MTRWGRRTATAVTALSVTLLAGCGVRPTGVLDGGESAGGLTKGLRLYFVSQSGRLEAVSRPGVEVSRLTDPRSVLKFLLEGPTQAEREAGLSTLLDRAEYDVTVKGETVAVTIGGRILDPSSLEDRNLTGQLVCSVARVRAMTDGTGETRTDDVPVLVQAQSNGSGPGDLAGTHVCSDFLRTV